MTTTPTYAPTWLPVPLRPWRLVDIRTGTFYRLRDERAKQFESAEAAIAYARKYKLPLTPHEGADTRSGIDRRINKQRAAGDYVANGDTAHEIIGRRALVFDGEDSYMYAERRKP